jgi:WS/DGAT/MGAT family acyltransferase
MPAAYHDRLSQLDNGFLIVEDALPEASMHIASTQIHEAGPLRGPDGSLDIERIEEYVASRLEKIPRYRQVLAYTPIEGHPVWVDDPSFNLHYHLRHVRLPGPGSERQLKRLVGRIFSQRLDREKPLWELWVIEGLEGDRIAIVSKVHHCLADGISGSEIIAALLTTEPLEKPPEPARWQPRAAPDAFALGVGEVTRLLRAPFDASSYLLRLARDADDARHGLEERLRAVGRTVSDMRGATPVPINQPIGPHRRIDWLPMSLERIKAVRRAAVGTVNDVVLATAAGGIGRFLARERGVDLRNVRFRVMAPVSTRTSQQGGAFGNRVSSWTVDLPIAEPDPLARLRDVHEQTAELRSSQSELGTEMLERAAEWTGSRLLSLGARLAVRSTPHNMVITNVPGPRVPLYLLGSRLLEIHPHVPLMSNQAVGIALFSYDGTLSWGFSADWDLVPDLHELVLATQRSFEELVRAAGIEDRPPGQA